jgi:hypothetical protein
LGQNRLVARALRPQKVTGPTKQLQFFKRLNRV